MSTRIEPVKSRGGVWVTLGDEEYRIPPLAFRALQDLADEVSSLRQLGAKPTPEQMTTVEKIIHRAMQRNYPDLTLEEVSDMLDIGNYEDVLGAALQISGYVQSKDRTPGEMRASTGTVSIAP